MALIVAGAVSAHFLTAEPEITPAEKLKHALELLDQGRSTTERLEAQRLLGEVEAADFVDPDFPAAIPFARGVIAFQDSRHLFGADQQKQLLKSIELLEAARLRHMPEERQHQLAYGLGIALQSVGSRTRARSFLEEALQNYAPGKVEVSLLLLDSYVYEQTDASLKAALEISQSLQDNPDLPTELREQVAVMRSQALQIKGEVEAAERALAEGFKDAPVNHETTLLRARALLSKADTERRNGDQAHAADHVREAHAMLTPLFHPTMPERIISQAMFLTARCNQQLQNDEAAINSYQQLMRRFPETHESIAASIEAGDLLRKLGRNEEALAAYRVALQTIRRPEDFRNRWLTISDFQASVAAAWQDWADHAEYESALELARDMAPLYDPVRSLESIAATHAKWAQALQSEFDSATFEKRRELAAALKLRWAESGRALERLADALRTTKRFPEIVMASAQHYALGGAYADSLREVNEFIRTSPKKGSPEAYLHRGRMEMQLNRMVDAIESFETVLKQHPTDPAAFEAELWIGYCWFERDQPADAERVWRQVMSSNVLDPTAREWRNAKLALARLLVELGTNAYQRSQSLDPAVPSEARQLREKAYSHWDEAIRHLDEYVRRYPNDAERFEARHLLVRTLHAATARLREQLQGNLPATTRAQLQSEISQLLGRAVNELRIQQTELQGPLAAGMLDELGQQLYRTTFLMIPHLLFELGLFEDALLELRTVVNRFPDDPMAMVAQIQMVRCFEQLGKSDDAGQQLEQAKLMLTRLSDQAFRSPTTALSRDEWNTWLDWAQRVREAPLLTTSANPTQPVAQ